MDSFSKLRARLEMLAEEYGAETWSKTNESSSERHEELDCCQSFVLGINHHINSTATPAEIAALYRHALTGHHDRARTFLHWLEHHQPVTLPFEILNYRNSEELVRVLKKIISNPSAFVAKTDSAEDRGLQLALAASPLLGKPQSHLWHSLKMLNDAYTLGRSFEDMSKAVSDVGPVHNYVDANGIPLPGVLREVSSQDGKGWMSIEQINLTPDSITVEGWKNTDLVPLIQKEDINVAIWLAFFESESLVSPGFSLNGIGRNTPSAKESESLRFNEKIFHPKWLGETNFGKSMFFADWLMKSFTMKDGLPSLTNPFVSGATVEGWLAPAFMIAIGDAGGVEPIVERLPLSTGRLEIICESVSVEKAAIDGNRHLQYRLLDINMVVDSSVYTINKDGSENHSHRRSLHTSPGERAHIIQENYEYISDIFPVFRRIKYILAMYSVLCRARDDGYMPSLALKEAILPHVSRWKSSVPPRPSLSPKPFHKGGCYCSGGVSAGAPATVTNTQTDPFNEKPFSPSFVVASCGWTVPIPEGATLREDLPRNGPGMTYTGGSGGHSFAVGSGEYQSFAKETSAVFIIDATNRHPRRAYFCSSFIDDRSGKEKFQKIDPFTRRTLDNNDPWAHIYPGKYPGSKE